MRPLVSVVLPVYNHAHFLAEALRSILEESQLPLEVIVVDDGSTDSPLTVLEKIRDSRVRSIRQENRGLAAALNTGFAQAGGSFLTWTSADNVYMRGALRRMADFLLANPAVQLVYANAALIGERGETLRGAPYRGDDQRAGASVLFLPGAAETLCELNDNFINACFLYRRLVAAIAGDFDSAKNGFEDYDYWLRASLLGSFSHLDTERPQYRYRLHTNTLTETLGARDFGEVQKDTVRRAARRARIMTGAAALELSVEAPDGPLRDVVCRALRMNGCAVAGAAGPESGAPGGCVRIELPGSSLASISLEPDGAPLACPSLGRYFAGLGGRLVRFSASSARGTARTVVLPPLEIPPLLKRARDGSRGAVTPERGTKTVLVFAPADGAEKTSRAASFAYESLMRCIPAAQRLTWVLFCRSAAERSFADRVNVDLREKANFRILDVSAEPDYPPGEAPLEAFSAAGSQERSLMYALSSADVLGSFKPVSPDNALLLELRTEAAIAAAAGLPLIRLSDRPEKSVPCLPHAAALLDYPHVRHFPLSDLAAAEASAHSSGAPDSRSTEQFIGESSLKAFGRLLKAFLLLHASE